MKYKTETPFQKQCFEIYYSLGENRSLEKLREKLQMLPNATRMLPNLTTLKRWSKIFNWQERIKERDEEINRRFEEEAKEKQKKRTEERLKIIEALLAENLRILKEYQEKIKTSGKTEIEIKTLKDLKEITENVLELIDFETKIRGEFQEKTIVYLIPKELNL